MKPLRYRSIKSTKAYDHLLKASYLRVKQDVEEIVMPPVLVIAVTGNEPPASKQYQEAIAVLYGLAFGLKMGLKFGKIARPRGYFDFRVGALGTFWWATRGALDIADATTLRWRAYLLLPPFVTKALLEQGRALSGAKHPEVPYRRASLQTLDEGRCVQILHVGRYDAEEPTIERLHRYVGEHGLAVAGRHHEIYISDPRRTGPEKLKTVIRFAVKPARRRGSRRAADQDGSRLLTARDGTITGQRR